MAYWCKFLVVGHHCRLRHDFQASNLATAEAFQRFWGGNIVPVKFTGHYQI